MFPWVTGFQWTTGNVIFLGLFFSVVLLVLGTLARVVMASRRALAGRPADRLRWEIDFEELPAGARACRHEITGDVRHRTCQNGFDCPNCSGHEQLERLRALRGTVGPRSATSVGGFDMPPDRFYHRGHAWARPEADGTMAVGLDDLGRRLLGTPDALDLPPVGQRLHASGPAWRADRNGRSTRILSPLEGEVVARGGPGDDWVLRLRPTNGRFETGHLLRDSEVEAWILRETERLQFALATGPAGRTLADGGVPVDDLLASLPAADWDAVWGEMFLQP